MQGSKQAEPSRNRHRVAEHLSPWLQDTLVTVVLLSESRKPPDLFCLLIITCLLILVQPFHINWLCSKFLSCPLLCKEQPDSGRLFMRGNQNQKLSVVLAPCMAVFGCLEIRGKEPNITITHCRKTHERTLLSCIVYVPCIQATAAAFVRSWTNHDQSDLSTKAVSNWIPNFKPSLTSIFLSCLVNFCSFSGCDGYIPTLHSCKLVWVAASHCQHAFGNFLAGWML